MAKVMVAIDIPDKSYDELRKKVIDQKKWHPVKSQNIVLVPAKYLDFNGETGSLFCELIGVRP